MRSPFTLEAESYETLEFEVPRRTTFQYKVAAEHPVSVFLLDKEGLDAFEQDEDLDYYEGSEGQEEHEGTVRLSPGTYYLVIDNEEGENTAVSYEVYY